MAEEGGGMWAQAGERISFAAETVGTVAAGVAGGVWANITQTQFSIDIAQAPKLIETLGQAIKELDKAYQKSTALRSIQSPGKDPYSGFTALAIRQSAGDGEGGYGWANREARKAFEHTIENIQKAIDDYGKTDDAAREALKQ
ncbi:hypothetical protein [Actinosynnema sp. NPDC023587]|uniref:hypothetical protein n=1 Tax=Actinosynnema sp. NPDC023587 TaxID=3154695 RepID=UPI0033E50043